MDKIAEQHRAIANLAAYLHKHGDTNTTFFLDGGLTLNISQKDHNYFLQDDTYQNACNYYQDNGGQLLLAEGGLQFQELAKCFN